MYANVVDTILNAGLDVVILLGGFLVSSIVSIGYLTKGFGLEDLLGPLFWSKHIFCCFLYSVLCYKFTCHVLIVLWATDAEVMSFTVLHFPGLAYRG